MKYFLQVALETLKYISLKITSGTVELLLFLMTFFAPAGLVLVAVGGAIAVDTYFGRKRAYREGKEVTSKLTRKGMVSKGSQYAVLVLSVFLVDELIVNDFVKAFFNFDHVITKLAGLTLIWVEYTSVNESYEKIKGYSLKDALRNMLKGARGIKKDIDETTK